MEGGKRFSLLKTGRVSSKRSTLRLETAGYEALIAGDVDNGMSDSKRKKILVIEGNEAFRKLLKKRLETAGFHVFTVPDGLEGLTAVRRENPDLIILDILLPGLDGHKICRMIKFDRKLKHIPVVVLTSRDLEEVAELAKQVKADAFCVKTTKAAVLVEIIQKLIERRHANDTKI